MLICSRKNQLCASTRSRHLGRSRGFTLVQLLVVTGIMAVLAVVGVGLFGSFQRTIGIARRATCDVHLKEIVLAMDTFRRETGKSPATLAEMVTLGYIGANSMRCPADPDLPNQSSNPTYNSYENFYLIREPGDSGELPVVLCPLHADSSPFSNQGYKGGYSTQHASVPAQLRADEHSGTVTITRPGRGVLALPGSGQAALQLRGGDRIRTGAGAALIRFADKSEARIDPNTEITVVDSFLESRSAGQLYTIVRQFSGKVSYYVNPGSFFDVATPTATAGALGTRFSIQILPSTTLVPRPPDTVLTVTEHAVAFSTASRTVEIVPADRSVKVAEVKKKKRTVRKKGWTRNKYKKQK